MAQTSPALAALLIVVIIVAIILLAMVLISRQSNVRTSSITTQADCTGPPSVPSGLSASNPQGDLIILDWNDIASAEEYVAYIGDTPGYNVEDALAVRTVNFSSASFANLELGFTYYFKVKSLNTCGESALSPELAFNLAFQFPNRFRIASRLASSLKICDIEPLVTAYSFCTDLNSWMFYQDADKTIRKSANPGLCMTRTPDTFIDFQACGVTTDQQWAYNAQDNTLCSFANPNANCLKRRMPLDPVVNIVQWGAKSTDEVSDWEFEPV